MIKRICSRISFYFRFSDQDNRWLTVLCGYRVGLVYFPFHMWELSQRLYWTSISIIQCLLKGPTMCYWPGPFSVRWLYYSCTTYMNSTYIDICWAKTHIDICKSHKHISMCVLVQRILIYDTFHYLCIVNAQAYIYTRLFNFLYT